MHKYNAHGATDVTGFGLLGHAQNLAKNQKNEVSFVIHNLPIIAKMAAVAKACGNMFHLLQVRTISCSLVGVVTDLFFKLIVLLTDGGETYHKMSYADRI